MSGDIIIAIGLIAGLFFLLMIGLEIAWSVGVIALVGLTFLVDQPVDQIAYAMWDSLDSFALTAMPLFILMGSILGNTGVSDRLFNAIDKWVGHISGGLVISVICGNAVFAAMSGSAMAAAATFGKISFPPMKSRGYSPSFALGSIAASSILAPLIPPSILLIIYGVWQGVSIVDLLAGGVVPGVMLTGLFVLTAYVSVKIRPGLAPSPAKYIWAERGQAFIDILPFAGFIFGVLGAIFGGFMTPTEAGALGALLSILLTLLYRRLTFKILQQSLLDTVRVTSFSLFIMAMATLLSHVFNSAGLIPMLKDYILGFEFSRYTILVLFSVMYLIMGCFFDSWSMLFLTFPFVMPIIIGVGIDPIWWGVIYVIIGEQSTITPPFGLVLFVMKSVVPEYPMGTVVKGALPYLIPIYINVILLTLFPQLVLWLPGILSGN